MVFRSLVLGLLATVAPSAVWAHSTSGGNILSDAVSPAGTFFARRDVSAGGKCGSGAGGASCGSGLCCSSAGTCGTGGSFCSGPDCQFSFGPACDANQSPTGKDTSNVPRPTFGNVPYGVNIVECSVKGKVALTFDDGPYIYTTELLDLLKRNNVKATFFIVGNNGGKGQINSASSGYRSIIQRMYEEGHHIGSHSWSHQDFSVITAQQRRDQVIKNEIALADILGFIPTYFRPPYTRCPADCMADLKKWGYHVLNYNIDTRDWQLDYNNARNVYNTILSTHSPANSGWISLAHDIQPETVHSFAQYEIDQAKKLGYSLVTVGECMGDASANWYRNVDNGQAWGNKQLATPKSDSSSSSSSSSAPPTSSAAATKSATSSAPPSTSSKSSSKPTSGSSSSSISSPSSTSQPSSSQTPSSSSSIHPTPSAVSGANFGGASLSPTSTAAAAATTTTTSRSAGAVLSTSSWTASLAAVVFSALLFSL